MMVGRISVALLAVLALARPLVAQDERWQVALDDGRYVWDIRLVRLEGNSLVVSQSDSLVRVPVAHITEVRLIQKTETALGDGAAGAMGALVGADDEIYDLSAQDLAERRRSIQKIFELHPAKP
jgi:hypothetical protein